MPQYLCLCPWDLRICTNQPAQRKAEPAADDDVHVREGGRKTGKDSSVFSSVKGSRTVYFIQILAQHFYSFCFTNSAHFA